MADTWFLLVSSWDSNVIIIWISTLKCPAHHPNVPTDNITPLHADIIARSCVTVHCPFITCTSSASKSDCLAHHSRLSENTKNVTFSHLSRKCFIALWKYSGTQFNRNIDPEKWFILIALPYPLKLWTGPANIKAEVVSKSKNQLHQTMHKYYFFGP